MWILSGDLYGIVVPVMAQILSLIGLIYLRKIGADESRKLTETAAKNKAISGEKMKGKKRIFFAEKSGQKEAPEDDISIDKLHGKIHGHSCSGRAPPK